MNITQSGNILTIVSSEISTYSYVHIIQNVTTVDTTIFDYEFSSSFSSFTLTEDGYFIITEIKLPTTPGYGYYISGNSVYDSGGNVVSVEDLLDIDTTTTNIVREDLDYFSTNILNNFYITYLQNNYLNSLCSGKLLSLQDKVTIDSITMGLSIIECLIDCGGKYYEAQRIIEKLSMCYGTINTNCNCHG